MTAIKLNHRENSPWNAVLTTDHPGISYGMPVLVFCGVAYGPLDTLNGPIGPCTAAFFVRTSEIQEELDNSAVELCTRFMDAARESLATDFQRQSYDYL